MYALLGIDTVLRIAAAMALLFVGVPALAWPRPASFSRLEWFWWNFGVGIAILTLAGQLFTLLNVNGTASYLVLLAAIVIVCRAKRAGLTPLQWIRESYRKAVVWGLDAIDGRRRIAWPKLARPHVPAAWLTVIAAAAITRFYRPFATANLGFSDTYVHLYLMRLLDRGRQIDPAWGPYPRGMHFLLLAIQRLTNVDSILMMNFFGAFAGVLMTIAVAYAAQRIAKSNVAALVAGVIFATMIGGAHQYFAFGGTVSTPSFVEAKEYLSRPYDQMLNAGEFDPLLTSYQRQTSTLPQELAIVLLFPAALFLHDFLRTRDRLRLIGFAACTAAIAAIHSGVVVPLVLLCACVAAAHRDVRLIARAAAAGAIGVAVGSTWMLGFIDYHRTVAPDSHVGSTALYYFPFLRAFTGAAPDEATAFMTVTPFLIVMLAVAIWVAFRTKAVWIALAFGLFFVTHAASTLGIPEIVEVRRNVTWLAMTAAVLLGAALVTLPRRVALVAPYAAVALWLATLPGPSIRGRIVDYSGYGETTYAVLLMSHRLEPFTWTLVSYGQEYPMVLGQGFHLNGADFLEQFDPSEPLRIPTRYVFIAVEKRPHAFQINTWAARFDRASIEERLQTWCTLYRMSHRDMRVFLDDDNVRVYEIARPAPEGGRT
jgi:hypothetical protein